MALHWYVLMVVSYDLALVCLDGGELWPCIDMS